MDYNITINGLPVNAHYTQANIDEVFLPLLKHLTILQAEKSKRVLVMLAAPPGAGKSTLSSFLEKLSKEMDGVTPIQAIGMDGFHRRQEYLLSHTTIRDGKEIPMVNIKGAPETFDLPLLTERIKKVVSGEKCGWPIYDRTTHNPLDNAITVDSDIVLLEGNYLLLEDYGWNELSSFADYTILLRANPKMLRNRLIARKALSGNAIGAATKFVDFSDMVNVNTCLLKSKDADLTLEVLEDDSIQLISQNSNGTYS